MNAEQKYSQRRGTTVRGRTSAWPRTITLLLLLLNHHGFSVLAVVLIAAIHCQTKPINPQIFTLQLVRSQTEKLLTNFTECNWTRTVQAKGISLQPKSMEKTACAFKHYLNRTLAYQNDLNPNSTITDVLEWIQRQFAPMPVGRRCQGSGHLENPSETFKKKCLSSRVLTLFTQWLPVYIGSLEK